MATIDPDNPCEAVQELRRVYYSILQGGQPIVVEFETDGGTRRRVEYARTNLDLLNQEITRLQTACDKRSGKSRRFVIRGR